MRTVWESSYPFSREGTAVIEQCLYRLFDSCRFLLRAGSEGEFHFRFIETKSFDASTLFYFFLVLSFLILAVVYSMYRYEKWKKYTQFTDEMRTLDLDPDSEGTLAFMVKRYSLDEPVKVLMSARLFDDMAQKEMMRVLASEGSQKAKEEFINTVYKIRNKTYRPEWMNA